MPDSALAISEEEFAKTYLGITPRDVLRAADLLNSRDWDLFWDGVRNTIESSALLNPVDSDTKEELQVKEKLKERAIQFLVEFHEAASSNRDGQILESKIHREGESFLASLESESQEIRNTDTSRIGQTLFGPDHLDASDVRISDIFLVERLGTLRSDSDAIVKKPRSFTQITVDLTFSGKQDINGRFRPFLAGLLASPITTMESPFLTAALINHFSSPEIEEAIRRRAATDLDPSKLDEFEKYAKDIEDSFSNLREVLASDDLVVEYLRTLQATEENEANEKLTHIDGGAKRVVELGVPIPVAFQDIVVSTDPVIPNTVHVRLHFLRYNSKAFGAFGLEYKDRSGNRTPDIMRCDVLRRYTRWAFLDPNKRRTFLPEYRPSENSPDFKAFWRDILDMKRFRQFPDNAGNDYVVGSVQLALNMKLAPLSILGSRYPAVQILGRSNVSAKIILHTTSREVVREFSIMKDHLDAISKNVGGQYRHEYVRVENAVLNMVAGHHFNEKEGGGTPCVITQVEMTPMERTTNAHTIEVTLVQARQSFGETEALHLVDNTTPESAIRAFWKYMWDQYQEYRTDPFATVNNPKSISEEAALAGVFLFGEQDDNKRRSGTTLGAINDDNFLAAAMYLLGGAAEQSGNDATQANSSQDRIWYNDPESLKNFYFRMFPTGGYHLPQDLGELGRGPTTNEVEAFVQEGLIDATPLAIDKAAADAVALRAVGVDNVFPDLSGTMHTTADPTEGLKSRSVIAGRRRVLRTLSKGLKTRVVEGHDEVSTNSSSALGAIWRPAIGLTKRMWDALLETSLDPRRSPKNIENARRLKRNSKIKWGDGYIYDQTQVQRLVGEIIFLFTSGNIVRFKGFDWEKWLKDATASTRASTRGNTIAPALVGEQSEQIAKRLSSNYPDLPLPTYAEMFVAGEQVVNERGKTVDLWTRFAPTYSDLGVHPPLSLGLGVESLFTIAHDRDNVMQPAFWFHHQRLRHGMLRRLKKSLQVPGQQVGVLEQRNELKVDVNTEEADKILQEQGSAAKGLDTKQTIYELIQEKAQDDVAVRNLIKEAREDRRYVDIVTSDGRSIAYFRPAGIGAANNEYSLQVLTGKRSKIVNPATGMTLDRKQESHNLHLLQKIMAYSPDQTSSMVRAFPAFRVYFVEWDNNEGRIQRANLPTTGRIVRMVDDLYTTNAILSIHITDSKDDAALAVVSISNTLGTFDTDTFLSKREIEQNNIGKDDEGEDFLKRMRLQTGIGIVIDVGYSSSVNGLRTVFTGQIAEITPGKIIQIKAQGYKTELDQEVEVEVNNGNPRTAINKILTFEDKRKNATPHLGRLYSTKDLTSQQITRLTGPHSSRTGVFGLEGPNGWLARTFGQNINSITRNIWFESNVGPDSWIGQAWRDVWETFSPDMDLEYHFYHQTAWQALKEMNRHHPGTITQVVPYGTEATVFWGHPEQVYQWRQPEGQELLNYGKLVKPERAESILGLELALLSEFWSSEYGTTNAVWEKRHLIQATRMGNRSGLLGSRQENNFYHPSTIGLTLNEGKGIRDIKSGGLTGLRAISPSFSAFIKWSATQPEKDKGTPTANFLSPNRFTSMVNRIPIHESLRLDFSADWYYVKRYNQQMARFIFAYWFKFRYLDNTPWPNSLESLWMRIADEGMMPLRNIEDESPSPVWGPWIQRLFGSNLNGDGAQIQGTMEEVWEDIWRDPEALRQAMIVDIRRRVAAHQMTETEAKERIDALNSQTLDDLSRNATDLVADLWRDLMEANPGQALRVGSTNIYTNPDVAVSLNEQGHVQKNNTIAEAIWRGWPTFRLFIHYFASWLRSIQGASGVVNEMSAIQQYLDQLQFNETPPWFKVFRDYHAVFSGHDIIENTINASTSEMANTILIRGVDKVIDFGDREAVYQGGGLQNSDGGRRAYSSDLDWVSWPSADGVPFHPELKYSSRKLAVAVEPNANDNHRMAQCLMTNMAEAIRPMYRGELKIVGRRVKPWDIVMISDDQTGMHGVIEVDRVVHEFTTETGWVTTVWPHAYCHANSPFGLWQLTQVSDTMMWIEFGLNVFSIVSIAMIFMPIVTGAVRGLVAGARAASAVSARAGAATQVASKATGATAEAVVAEAASAEVAVAAGAGFKDAVGLMGRNFFPTLGRIGRRLGTLGVATELVPTVAHMWMDYNLKMRVGNLSLPIDLRPLSFKGIPLTAGLDLVDDNVLSFADKEKKLWKTMKTGVRDWFKVAKDMSEGKVGTKLPVQEGGEGGP